MNIQTNDVSDETLNVIKCWTCYLMNCDLCKCAYSVYLGFSQILSDISKAVNEI